MPFHIIRNDITEVKADAIVNTANPKLVISSVTYSAIYKAASEKLLLAERKKIGGIALGQAVSTDAFGLQVKQKEDADKRLLSLEIFIGMLVTVIFLALIFVAAFVPMANWLRILLIVTGFIPFAIGISYAIRI